ncbi:GIY-YIG nuclease family protein [Bacillus subtilis]|nr:GIY-YIG nuclease family protein [Bacillus subtilis]
MISITLPNEYIQDKPTTIKSSAKYTYGGVYIFFNEDNEALYVGKTQNFKSRFADHFYDNRFFKEAAYARLYEVKDEFERDIYETQAIREFDPIFNKAKVYHRLDEIDFELSVIEAEAEELIASIKELKQELNEIYEKDDEYIIDITSANDTDGDVDHIETLGDVFYIMRQIDELDERLSALKRRKLTLTNRRHL